MGGSQSRTSDRNTKIDKQKIISGVYNNLKDYANNPAIVKAMNNDPSMNDLKPFIEQNVGGYVDAVSSSDINKLIKDLKTVTKSKSNDINQLIILFLTNYIKTQLDSVISSLSSSQTVSTFGSMGGGGISQNTFIILLLIAVIVYYFFINKGNSLNFGKKRRR